jgi:hypothetical protein
MRILPSKTMKGGIAYPAVQLPYVIVTQSRLPDYTFLRWLHFLKPIKTIETQIMSIVKLDLSKLYVFCQTTKRPTFSLL